VNWRFLWLRVQPVVDAVVGHDSASEMTYVVSRGDLNSTHLLWVVVSEELQPCVM